MCDELRLDDFVVSEHGFQSETIHQFTLNNYQLANYFCRDRFKGCGVSTSVRDPVDFEALSLNYSCELNFEAQGVKVQTSLAGKIVIVGVYRSPNGCLLTKLLFNSSNFILIDDININVIYPTNSRRLRDTQRSFIKQICRL